MIIHILNRIKEFFVNLEEIARVQNEEELDNDIALITPPNIIEKRYMDRINEYNKKLYKIEWNMTYKLLSDFNKRINEECYWTTIDTSLNMKDTYSVGIYGIKNKDMKKYIKRSLLQSGYNIEDHTFSGIYSLTLNPSNRTIRLESLECKRFSLD